MTAWGEVGAGRIRRWKKKSIGIAALCLIVLAGCESSTKGSIDHLSDKGGGGIKILLMPLDVELGLLTAGGVVEPNAEWTEAAKQHMLTAISDMNAERGLEMVIYDQDAATDEYVALERLHSVVGITILQHDYIGQPLPTKKDVWDWTLGPSMRTLAAGYDADYALFIYVRDSYSSGGRVALQIAAAVVGVSVSGGQQIGFASLVDLDTGEIGWFNLLARGTGDLRTEKPARETVAELLEDLPE